MLTFEEFQAIPVSLGSFLHTLALNAQLSSTLKGCVHGTRTAERSEVAKPVVTAPGAANKAAGGEAPTAVSTLPPPAPVAARATTPAPPIEIVEDEDDPSVAVPPGTMCRRPGCRKQFVSDEESRQGDGEGATCQYHANQVRQ